MEALETELASLSEAIKRLQESATPPEPKPWPVLVTEVPEKAEPPASTPAPADIGGALKQLNTLWERIKALEAESQQPLSEVQSRIEAVKNVAGLLEKLQKAASSSEL